MIKLGGKALEINRFPDGTLLIKKDIYSGEHYWINWKYETDSELFVVYCLAKHIHEYDGIPHLTMRYIPNARQDRIKKPEDVFTLKYFADIINRCDFASVKVLDPHSSVSEALFNKIIVEGIEDYISEWKMDLLVQMLLLELDHFHFSVLKKMEY